MTDLGVDRHGLGGPRVQAVGLRACIGDRGVGLAAARPVSEGLVAWMIHGRLTTPPDPGVEHRGEYPQLTLAMTGWILLPQLFLKVTMVGGWLDVRTAGGGRRRQGH